MAANVPEKTQRGRKGVQVGVVVEFFVSLHLIVQQIVIQLR